MSGKKTTIWVPDINEYIIVLRLFWVNIKLTIFNNGTTMSYCSFNFKSYN